MKGRFSGAGLRLGALFAASALCFAALGAWQLQRRELKHELIARVQARVQATPVAAPGRAGWPHVTPITHEYLRVVARGRVDHERATLVQAATALGAGYWVLTPLVTADGSTILVNRGFVPPERSDRAERAAAGRGGDAVVSGLLRISEPGGGFLRSNDAKADRWYSRDVAEIAAARGLVDVAPYFIDAEATPGVANLGAPVGGLTVVAFTDHHGVYALTWFSLAALAVAALGILLRADCAALSRRQ